MAGSGLPRQSPMVSGGSVEKRAGQTARALLRLIHDQRLLAGDRLPAQEALRRALKVGNGRINAAMRLLVRNGILQRQTKTGTVVKQPDALLPNFWTVGLPAFVPHEPGGHSFFVHLHHSLEMCLLQAGCRIRVYVQPCNPDGVPRSLGLYEDLLADADDGELDAVVSPVVIEPRDEVGGRLRGIPAVHVAASETEPCAVLIDRFELARQAVQRLAGQGGRHLALVMHGSLDAAFRGGWDGFRAGLAEAGEVVGESTPWVTGRGLEGGVQAARELLARPADRRPDGLVVMDDWIAHGLADLLRRESDYRPLLAVQTSRQVPLGFALPVIRYEVDIDALARQAVDLCLAGLTGRHDLDRVQWVQATVADDTATMNCSDYSPAPSRLTITGDDYGLRWDTPNRPP